MLFSLETRANKANFLIKEAKDTQGILSCLKSISLNAIIFIDIHDTIITPVSKTFRRKPFNQIMDNIKKNKKEYGDFYELIVSNWRKERKVMLIDQGWPNLLNDLKKDHRVYGLTKIDTGKFGSIESMEEWLYSELKNFGIEFSNDMGKKLIGSASFDRGLFITGDNSKSQTLEHYLEHLVSISGTFVMIDDRKEQLEDVKGFCEKKGIKFCGILFNGLEKLEDYYDFPDLKIVSLQKIFLTKTAKWLEDKEAEEKLTNQPADETEKELIEEALQEAKILEESLKQEFSLPSKLKCVP